MGTLTTNYLDIIERLPAGAKLELPNVDWDEYEDGQTAHFYRLVGESCETIRNSVAFPILTAADLTGFPGQSKVQGQTATPKAFRQMLRSRAPS